jgi:hypothetical protein
MIMLKMKWISRLLAAPLIAGCVISDPVRDANFE